MKAILDQYVNLTQTEFDAFLTLGTSQAYPKNQVIQREGNVCRKYYFVQSGLLRGYRLLNGNDVTYHFFLPGWFATDYQSFLTGEPGNLFLETLAPTTVYEFEKEVLLQAYETNPKLERLGRLIAERAYLIMAERFKNLQADDLASRYQKLLQKEPRLFQAVPQKHIASYLGVQPQSLSRLKAQLRQSDLLT